MANFKVLYQVDFRPHSETLQDRDAWNNCYVKLFSTYSFHRVFVKWAGVGVQPKGDPLDYLMISPEDLKIIS